MRKLCLLMGLIALGAASLMADAVSYTGIFQSDDQTATFTFNLATDSVVTLETLSYGGGTNSASAVIPAGGFDPRLSWFASDGTGIGSDDGGHCGSTAMFNGACNDAYFNGTLSAGTYTLVLTVDGNDPNGDLIDGFSEDGQGNFTTVGSCPMFCDSLSGNALTGNYDVEILSTAITAPGVPEPATFALSGSILALFFVFGRKYRRS